MVKKQPENTSINTEEKVDDKQKSVTDIARQMEGTTIIDEEVVASIAGFAAGKVKGVESLGKTSFTSSVSKLIKSAEDKARTGVDAEVGKKETIINLEVGVSYGYYIPDIVKEIRQNVASALKETTGLVAREINVRIVSIKFPDTKKKES